MVICKYFQQGYCRFGQSCRFEHVYGSKYNYQAPQSAPPQGGVTDEQLVHQVQSDVQAALKGGQWLLSSYAPFKEKPILPGIPNLSPEEARLFIYEAKATNNIDQAVTYMNNLSQETRHKYEQLLQPTPTIMKALRSLFNGEVVSSPFSNVNQMSGFGSNQAASIFGSAVQNTNVFGQANTSNTSSVFGQQPNSVFGSPTSDNAAKSIFAQASQTVFGSPPANNVFAQSPDAAKSVFAQANQNVFASQSQQTPANVFATASQQFFGSPPSGDPFGQTSPFNNTQAPSRPTIQQSSADDILYYSNMEDLTPDDLEAFNSSEFRLGFIPEIPPPRALCF